MDKVKRLISLISEAQSLMNEINDESDKTGVAIVGIDLFFNPEHEPPGIHFQEGLKKISGNAPISRKKIYSCKFYDSFENVSYIDGIRLFELDHEKAAAV